jgi:hypothetical protein
MGFLNAERIVACCFSIRRETLTDQAGYCTVTATVRIVAAGGSTLLPCIIDKAQWRVPGT